MGEKDFMRGAQSSCGTSPVPPPPTRENPVMGTWLFLKNLENWSGEKFSFWYPASESLD